MVKKSSIRLKRIDLSQSQEHDCPGIHPKRSYLCKIGGRWFAGTFSRVWFGLSFEGWYDTPLQFDAPGTNGSNWEEVYKIQSLRAKRKKKD